MPGLPIPNDHNLTTDPYTTMTIIVPDSPMWRGVVRGMLLNLADSWHWDAETGDAAGAAQAGFEIFDSVTEP